MKDLYVNGILYQAEELSICGATTLLQLTNDEDSTVHVVPTQWWISDKDEITHGRVHYSKSGDQYEEEITETVEEAEVPVELTGSLGAPD